MKRLRAFTIVELVVALAISSLVIVLAASCYQLVRRMYAESRVVMKQRDDISQLRRQLTHDMEEAPFLLCEGEHVLALEIRGVTVRYHLLDQFVVREQLSRLDTFYQPHTLAVENKYGLPTCDTLAWIDLRFENGGAFTYWKNYAASDYLNTN